MSGAEDGSVLDALVSDLPLSDHAPVPTHWPAVPRRLRQHRSSRARSCLPPRLSAARAFFGGGSGPVAVTIEKAPIPSYRSSPLKGGGRHTVVGSGKVVRPADMSGVGAAMHRSTRERP
jgi:hypothetical protein